MVALTGCIAQSSIQAKYMSQESTCRDQAREQVSAMQETAPGADINSAIFAAFSACMNKEGWKVSVPKPKPAVATTAPAVVVPTVAAPVVVGAPAKPPTAASVAKGANPPAAPVIGPGHQPDPAPAAATGPAPAAPAAVVVAPAPEDGAASYKPSSGGDD